jgi:hypothetical protein
MVWVAYQVLPKPSLGVTGVFLGVIASRNFVTQNPMDSPFPKVSPWKSALYDYFLRILNCLHGDKV